jgi:AraC family transcriptional regulator
MLKHEQNLTDIAMSCGFADSAHFSNAFNRATGFKLSAWRRLFTLEQLGVLGLHSS